jgi:hypothetical protein
MIRGYRCAGRQPAAFSFLFSAKPPFARCVHIDFGVAQTTRHMINAFAIGVDVAFDNAIR